MEVNIFETATRNKLRFMTQKGSVSIEDLWDLSLESLDTVAKTYNKLVTESAEESYIKKQPATSKVFQTQFDVVLRIIEVKLAEKDARQKATFKANERAKLLDLLEQKKTQELQGKSVEEIEMALAALDA